MNFVSFISTGPDSDLSYVLFILGLALFYLELHTTAFVAGFMGAVCLILAGVGFHVLPVNWWVIALLFLAFIVAISFYVVRERRRQRIPKDYYSLIGKEAMVLSVASEQEHGFYVYNVKVHGEIWKAKSHHLFKEGDLCIVRDHSDKDLILRVDSF